MKGKQLRLERLRKRAAKRRRIRFPVLCDSRENDVLSPPARRNALAEEF
jgi:hypothetical protein